MQQSERRKRARRRGLRAETLAAAYLRLKGYRIVKKNYKSNLGEIDLIAFKRKTLVFVEIKWRPNPVEAVNAITRYQQERILKAAEGFIARHPRFAGCGLRFDAILLSPWRWPRHLAGAWDSWRRT